MSTKHVFNDSDALVLKSLRGAVALNPGLRLHTNTKSVYSKVRNKARVALISGGGAGHEPAHVGYTGRGMLAASVSGDIFASPSAAQVLACIQLAIASQDTNKVLIIVNNYTGDRLNFGLAAERARSLYTQSELHSKGEVEVEVVVVADDISLVDRPSLVGARGLAGNILVCKILGGAAEAGSELGRLKKLGDAVVANLASIGVGLAHCHVPGRKVTTYSDALIEDGMCELGLGLHNEPGVRKMEVTNAGSLVCIMIEQILSSSERKTKARGVRDAVQSKSMDEADQTVLFVNNLGGLSTLEMSAIVDEAVSQLEIKGVHPVRILLSSYMTSLNAPGFSISILNLSAVCRDFDSNGNLMENITTAELLSFVDFPTDATAWVGVRSHWPERGTRRNWISEEEEASLLLSTYSEAITQRHNALLHSEINANALDADSANSPWTTIGIDHENINSGIREACLGVLEVENDLTQFDTIVGDGDCGETFSSGARAVMRALDTGELNVYKLSPCDLMAALSDILLNSMGGTSGALFGLYFSALSNALSSTSTDSSFVPMSHRAPGRGHVNIASAPLSALEALSEHTPARPKDRTLVDTLSPFCISLASGEGLDEAVKKAREGAESTRGMQARLGRATYVGRRPGSMDIEDASKPDSYLPPDPGAWGVAAMLEGLVRGLRGVEIK